MKKLVLFLILLSANYLLKAQVPQGINYQAVLRDGSGIISSENVEVRFSILQSGAVVAYEESLQTQTSSFGLITHVIGTGNPEIGTFAAINWEQGNLKLRVSIKRMGDTQFRSLGTQDLSSVPFSLFAQEAFTVINDAVDDADADPVNELQSLSISGNTVSLNKGGGDISLPTYTAGAGIIINGNTIGNSGDGDSDSSNEIQSLSINGNTISLNKGGGDIALPNPPTFTAGTGIDIISGVINNIGDSDADPNNEIQTLSINGNIISLDNGGGDINLPNPPALVAGTGIDITAGTISNTGDNDNDAVNEIQNLSISGNTISLSLGGGDITLPAPPTFTAGAGIDIVSGTINNTGDNDNDAANEIQTISISSDTISLSNGGGFVVLPASSNLVARGPNGGIKNFIMPHPTKPGKEIAYVSLEGPEAGAYTRGTAQLLDGEAEIVFSEHFQLVANHETMTIMTSPLSANSEGLAVVEKTATGFKVKELRNGKGNYSFDWEVKAVRKGWENYPVIRDENFYREKIEIKRN